jgi:hypothetical protein
MGCNSGGMAALNLWVKRNAKFRRTFVFKDDTGTAYNIAGWGFELEVRPSLGSGTTTFTVNLTANGNGSVITITDAAAGEIEVYISNIDIVLIPAASPATDPQSYVYDLVATDTSGDFAPFFGGTFTVIPGVTVL